MSGLDKSEFLNSYSTIHLKREPKMKQIQCGEIWGGNQSININIMTSGVEASIFSSSCDGDKGGDLYYISVCNGNLLTRIAIADVTGHGETVSEVSNSLYRTLSENINVENSNRVLTGLNSAAVDKGIKAITTAVVAAYYRTTNRLYFSYAGHYPILIRRSGVNGWQSLHLPKNEHAANLPLGISEQLPYDQEEIPMESGDMIFMYTDGVVDARNNNGEMFGECDLFDALNRSLDSTNDVKLVVQEAIKNHVNGYLIHDDVTFIAVKIL